MRKYRGISGVSRCYDETVVSFIVANDGIAYYESTGHTMAFSLFAVGLSKGWGLLAIIAGERFSRLNEIDGMKWDGIIWYGKGTIHCWD